MKRSNIFVEDCNNVAKYLKSLNFPFNKIMITGATGMIGSFLIKSLLAYGSIYNVNLQIYACIRNINKAKSVFSNDEIKNINIITKEDLEHFTEKKIDCIIHTASPTDSLELQTKPISTIQTIVFETNFFLSLAKQTQCDSFIFLSSIEVYGKFSDLIKTVKEKDLGYISLSKPRSSYPEAKRLAELLCFSYWYEHGLNTQTARLTQTFGSELMHGDNRIFAQIARSVVNNTDIVLHTDGSFSRNYCYLTDTAKALFLIATRGYPGETYNVSNDDTFISVKEMAEMVCHKIANDSIKIVYNIPKDITKYGYSPQVNIKMCSNKLVELGWKPEYNLEQMYRRLVLGLTEI